MMSLNNLRIVNGKIWVDEDLQEADVLIHNGKIQSIQAGYSNSTEPGMEILDAQGCMILPGGVDMHAHIQDGAETFFYGSSAAVKGGITTVVDMPPFQSVITRKQWEVRRNQAEKECVSDFGFTGGILIDVEDLSHLEEVMRCGVSQFKIFMLSKPSDELLWKAMQKAAKVGFRLTIHMEEPSLLGEVNWNDPLGFPKANPPQAENVAVARMLEMARAAGARVHVCHVSSARSAELIDRYKSWGTAITAETTPHYLILNENIFQQCPERAIVTPAIRTEHDNQILWEAVEAGVIDTIVSDHFLGALPDPSRKRPAPKDSEPGMAGLEMSMPLVYDRGVREGKLSLRRFIGSIATKPAEIIGMGDRKGKIKVGMDADMVCFNPVKEWKVADLGSDSRISTLPYENWSLHGFVERTIVRGKTIWDGKSITCDPGWGIYVPAFLKDNHYLENERCQ